MLYKLTDMEGRTHGGTKWGEGVTHKAKGKGRELCSNDVIHCYSDPYMAMLLNPIQGNFNEESMLLWECRGRVATDDGTKGGCKSLTTIKTIPVPVLSLETRVSISIHLALQVYGEENFTRWSIGWLDNKDRTSAAAGAAARVAGAAARVAGKMEAQGKDIILETIMNVRGEG